MQADHVWRQTPTDEIRLREPSEAARAFNEQRNDEILDGWGIPLAQRCAAGQDNREESALRDATVNMTVWFSTLSSLVEEAAARGLHRATIQFIDVGCGVGLAALFAVEALGFASATGIEYDEDRVHEARALISRASVESTTKDHVSIVHADAATYRLPESTGGSRFIFIFNAFGPQSLHAFLQNNLAGFTSVDVIGLANDVILLEPLTAAVPGCTWIRSDAVNSSLIFPTGQARLIVTRDQRTTP